MMLTLNSRFKFFLIYYEKENKQKLLCSVSHYMLINKYRKYLKNSSVMHCQNYPLKNQQQDRNILFLELCKFGESCYNDKRD